MCGYNCLGGVVGRVLASVVVNRGFEPQRTKDYKIYIFLFFATHAVLRSKRIYWFARNIRIMFPSGVTDLPADCCFTIKIPTKHVGLDHHHHLIEI
jgi:hypothetical protein